MNLRADGVRRVFLFSEVRHGHYATGIDSIIRDFNLRSHDPVVVQGDERRVVIRHDHRGARSKPVQRVVWVATAAVKMENITHPTLPRPSTYFWHAFENKCVKPVARMRVGACEPLIEQQREPVFVSQFRGEHYALIRIHPPVRLRPIKDVRRSHSRRCVIELSNSFPDQISG